MDRDNVISHLLTFRFLKRVFKLIIYFTEYYYQIALITIKIKLLFGTLMLLVPGEILLALK